jgi:hypothetical protein
VVVGSIRGEGAVKRNSRRGRKSCREEGQERESRKKKE